MTTFVLISAHQYAYDAAIPSLTADRLQRSLDVISEIHMCWLIVNIMKKDVLRAASTDAPTISINRKQAKKS